jgi:CubicO group peptidase (beta-lactamase class C family)
MQKLDRGLTRRENSDEFAGAVLVARDGVVLLDKAYGFADLERRLPNTTSTRFQLASVAKTLTATAVMQLVVKGAIDLDAALPAYFADLPPAWQNVTVAQLLSHTSGIPDYFSFDEFETERDLTPEAILAAAYNYPLDFDPGTEFSYSNTGYVILGMLIEKVSGKSYAEFLRANVLDPAGMRDTGREDMVAPRAAGYRTYGEPAPMFPITNRLGDGDLYGTTGDLYKFDRALRDDTLLPRALREKMFTPVGNNHYGLGWEVQSWNGKRVLSHSGRINGFATEFLRFPDDDAVIVVLGNIESFDAVASAYELAAILFP